VGKGKSQEPGRVIKWKSGKVKGKEPGTKSQEPGKVEKGKSQEPGTRNSDEVGYSSA